MKTILGIAVVDGIALANAFLLVGHEKDILPSPFKDIETEHAIFKKAIQEVNRNISARLDSGSKSQYEIFTAHLMILEDPELFSSVEKKIAQKMSAAEAIRQTTVEFAALFLQLEDAYMRERATDIKDIGQQLIAAITGNKNFLRKIQRTCILVVQELTPSIVSDLDPKYVLGVISETGGITSHAAILLKNQQIPAVFGVKNAMTFLTETESTYIDGARGLIHYNFSEIEKKQLQQEQENWRAKQKHLAQLKNMPTLTKNGERITLLANINCPADIDLAIENGADGVGLMRTEFLFLKATHSPSEDSQFEIYKKMLERFPNKKVTIRTLDIGGDKSLSFLPMKKEDNTFLGLRGLRLSLHEQVLFRTQLRALLRASSWGKLAIMFPMVTELNEFLAAKKIVQEEKEKLFSKGLQIGSYQLGLMVEVPACALQIEDFMPHADFFSIGTNDLTQYLCAVDRLNPSVADLYHYSHRALHKLLKMVLDTAFCHEREVSVCGEMASQTEFTQLLLCLGLKNFSVSPGTILKTREAIALHC